MDVLHYYELKQKYQESINRKKQKIKKDKKLSVKGKRTKIKTLINKCVNCDKPGGTVFEEKNGTLKAVCGSKTPCNLNINIKRKVYDNIRDLDHKNSRTSESLKMRIIMTKLDYLFGLISSKDEVVDKFNTLKNELAQINEIQLVNKKKYGDIISGIHREPLLNDAAFDLVNEIAELKQIYQEYLADPLQGYLTTMVEKYLTTIKPLTEKIRNMTYAYYAIEANVEKGEKKAFEGEGEENNDEKSGDVDDEAISKEKKAIYTLVALPYRLEQLEQERK
jgi:hypothetical protein